MELKPVSNTMRTFVAALLELIFFGGVNNVPDLIQCY